MFYSKGLHLIEDIETQEKIIEDTIKRDRNVNIPWIEKYKPRTLDDLVLSDNLMMRFKQIIRTRTMSNIIITGESGVGKTSSVICLVHDLFDNGCDHLDNVIEINASDDKGGINIRDRIELFCKKRISSSNDFRVVILDEFDNMPSATQSLIKDLIDTYHTTTRFVLMCNSTQNVIEPIQSRCNIFRFTHLNEDQIFKKIKEISDLEGIVYDDDGLYAIATVSQGDMRQAINNLHFVFSGFGSITCDNVYKMCDKPNPIMLKRVIEFCQSGDVGSVFNLLDEMKKNGYSNSDIISGLYNYTIALKNDVVSIEILDKICPIINDKITDIQLYGTIATLF